MILLDTHVCVWAVQGETRRLGRRTRQLLARAERQAVVRISPASIFEVSALHTLGRLRVTRPIESWIREAAEASGLRIVPLTPELAVDAGRIGRTALTDPLERILG